MGLLDEFLKEYQGGNLSEQNLSPLSEEGDEQRCGRFIYLIMNIKTQKITRRILPWYWKPQFRGNGNWQRIRWVEP